MPLYASFRICFSRTARLSADDRRIAVLKSAFEAFSGCGGHFGVIRGASEDADRPSSAQPQQAPEPRADRIFCSSFPAKQNGAPFSAPFCFLLSDRFMHRREHQRLPALRNVGRCVCSAALAPSSKRNCCAGTSSACSVALTIISSSRRNA